MHCSHVVVCSSNAAVDDHNMQYKACAKINASWECNLLVVASAHLVLCLVRGWRELCLVCAWERVQRLALHV